MLKRFYTILFLLPLYILLPSLEGIGGGCYAQVYPVQIVPMLMPPPTVNVTQWYNDTTEKLVVVLTNTDLRKPTLEVKLRMKIESQSVKLSTRDGSFFKSIPLDAGVPTRLSLGDLAPYFNPDNLVFQGITRGQYQQTYTLPEGMYSICFEAVEVYAGQLVGRSSCAMAWLSLNAPPMLNLPFKGESIKAKDPTNIIFQWTNMAMNDPNTAFNTEYVFDLVELWDNGLAPEAAFGTAQPLYRTTTRTTTLLYGPMEPLLIPGKRYAWRVKAQASDGSQNSSGYRNNGYSEIYWFTYQNDCPAPLNVQAEVTGTRATISWMPTYATGNLDGTYKIDYRERSQSSSGNWYSQTATTNRQMLYDLKKDKTYEYRVGASCDGNLTYVYSDIKSFTTEGSSNKESDVYCGTLSPEIKLTNRTPLQTLHTGEVFIAGTFPVHVTQASGSGSFTGQGYVTVPMLGENKLKVRFAGITINTDKQLIGGVVETTFDPKETQVADANDVAEGVKEVAGILNELVKMNVDKEYAAWKDVYNKVKEKVMEEMPEELKQKTQTAFTSLDNAKKEYDAAKKEYDSASTPEAKQVAQKKVEEAASKYNKAKDELSAVQKEQEQWTKDATNIIVKAIKELKNEYDARKDAITAAYNNKEKELDQYISKSIEALTGKTIFPASKSTGEGIVLSIENTDTKDDQFQMLAKSYSEAELINNKAIAVSIFDRDITNKEYYEMLQKVFTINGKAIALYVKERKEAKDTEELIVKQVKDQLDQFIEQLLTAKNATNNEK